MAKYGLFEIFNGDNAEVDIVFLHGLRGSMESTWSKDKVFWPQELLPQDVPKARIYLFGYDSGITHRDQANVTKTEIHSDADDLCAKLAAERSSTNTLDRPIIFIAHSLGGLVAAQILVHGEQSSGKSGARAISKNLRGLIFLGTPFRGSKAAKPGEIARRILESFGVNTQTETLKLLGVDSKPLDELTRAFANVLNKRRSSKDVSDAIEAFFFYETKKTRVAVGSIQIVEPESAQLPGCGDAAPIRADHREICKFGTDKDDGYVLVVASIRKAMLLLVAEPDKAGTTNTINVLGKAVNVSNGNIIVENQTNNL